MAIDFGKARYEFQKDKSRFYLILSGDKEFIGSDLAYVADGDKVKTITYKELVYTYVDKLIHKRVNDGNEIIIVAGDNNGIDDIARSYSIDKDYDMIKFVTEWEALGSRAGYLRNEDMFMRVGYKRNKGAILFWNGTNPYTLNLIYQAYVFGTPLRVYMYKDKRWLSQEEIEDIQYTEREKQSSWRRNRNDEQNK